MIENSTLARLTFNNPAMTSFFNKSGVRVKVLENTVFLKPAEHEDYLDSLEVIDRGSRGKQILISGEDAEKVVSILSSFDVEQYPYFVLKYGNRDWLRLEHHNEKEPPRVIAAVRFWMPKDGVVYKAPEVASDELPNLDEMISRIVGSAKAAHAIIQRNSSEKRLGRPTRQVQNAKTVMMFCSEIAQMTPILESFVPHDSHQSHSRH